jgi:hypothetical protein
MMETNSEEILNIFKALVNEERLRLVGLLALQPATLSQLAEKLKIQPKQAAGHLDMLVHVGIVMKQETGYALDKEGLQSISRRVLAGSRPATRPEEFEGEKFERKVLADFMLPDGRLKSIPAPNKKRLVIVAYLANLFIPGERYSEKQVNAILLKVYDDPVTLRRYLVDDGFLQRTPQGSEYWKAC